MGNRQTSELVIEAVTMAIARREPDTELIHHSDKGCQYTSLDFTNRLRELGLVPSYGSTGDCYDNAAMETFWATLKRELSWMRGRFDLHEPITFAQCSLRLHRDLLQPRAGPSRARSPQPP